MSGLITDVEGVFVGTFEDREKATGCSVILFENGAYGAVEKRGLAAGTRQLDPLFPEHLVDAVHAIVLTGGSSFGLEVATGVCEFLERSGIGVETEGGIIPIVPTGVIYDLNIGKPGRPDKSFGVKACENLSKDVSEGNAGVGMGATVGKLYGMERACKGGVGTWSVELPGGIHVGAYVVVNAVGDVVDVDGRILAGLLSEDKKSFVGTEKEMLRTGKFRKITPVFNTTIAVVATDLVMDKLSLRKVARMGANGLARVIHPFNTSLDGDMVFSVSTARKEGSIDVDVIGVASSLCLMEAAKRAVLKAEGIFGVPSSKDIGGL